MEFSEEEIMSLALENNEEAKNLIYEKYKYIVDAFLYKYRNIAKKNNIDLKELEQEAYYAFSDALNSYREDKNTKVSTFLFLCIDRRLKKIIKKQSGEKAKVLKNSISLDYTYEEGSSLKDHISDDLQFDPLSNLTEEESYQELTKKIKDSLSPNEYEIYSLMLSDFDYQTIAKLTNKNAKQVDNTIQRIKHKIRDIIKD